MSAYIVDQQTAAFIVNAAINYGLIKRSEALSTANMLMQENQKSIEYRYGCDEYANIVVFTNKKQLGVFDSYDPRQVVKSCEHFAYQACEHRTWEQSKAHGFIKLVEFCAVKLIKHTTSIKDTVWGAPDPVSMMQCTKIAECPEFPV